jgi:hypothetical protein
MSCASARLSDFARLPALAQSRFSFVPTSFGSPVFATVAHAAMGFPFFETAFRRNDAQRRDEFRALPFD